MDVIIPSPDKLKVVSHNQYDAPESLTPSTVPSSPLDQFRLWFTEVQGKVKEPEAMSVSTVTASGIPSSRFVLMKELDDRGFVFYTNYNSRKSRELEENPNCALGFYWREVHRQIRVVGKVEKVDRDISAEYFKTRPVGSRLGAWASEQSSVVKEGELKEKLDEVKVKFGIQDENEAGLSEVHLPEFWGGWRIVPNEVEFWLGKPSRLHDRIRYLRVEGSPDDKPEWKIERLAP